MRGSVLVAGAGHNGLVAAILAAEAGFSVTVVEAADHAGGATQGTRVFAGLPARLSRYAYLVSLFPQDLADRLQLDLRLAPRSVASYTPVHRDGKASGLLVERDLGPATQESFRALTGSDAEFDAWQQFYGEVAEVAKVAAPMLTGPLQRRSAVQDAVVAAAGSRIWEDLFVKPLGVTVTERFADDDVRGIVATDGLIGTFTSLFDESLLANRCFLYHLIGRGTGDWLVPIGGMGAVTDSLLCRAQELGVTVEYHRPVAAAQEHADGVEVQFEDGTTTRADFLLGAVAPLHVENWLGRTGPRPVGAQLKVNMLLNRLPQLASGIDPRLAFAGTTHLEESFSALEQGYHDAAGGVVPQPLPAEVYCHSLADSSILNGFGGATLTLFGLHTPDALYRSDSGVRDQAVKAALDSLQRHLAEPLEDCLARDADGEPCIDVATTVDLENTLRMPGGSIFHGDLDWPWLADDADGDDIATAHGVAVAGARRILLAGAGSVRGGGVSGLGGAAAVDALLELDQRG